MIMVVIPRIAEILIKSYANLGMWGGEHNAYS